MRFLVIEGNIGSGKTSFSKMVADDFNAKLVLEQFADNPFLPRFYKNKERYSFPLELSFLADRYKQLKKEVLNPDLFQPFMVADYYFSKTMIFAENTLQDDEYHLFRQIFDIVSENIPHPNLYVYLHANTERLLTNIKKRGRDYEQNIEPEYLESIEKGYFRFLKQVQNFPVLIVDTNNIDFVHNPADYQRLKSAVFHSEYKLGLNRLIL